MVDDFAPAVAVAGAGLAAWGIDSAVEGTDTSTSEATMGENKGFLWCGVTVNEQPRNPDMRLHGTNLSDWQAKRIQPAEPTSRGRGAADSRSTPLGCSISPTASERG
jgi:hypothetical protein